MAVKRILGPTDVAQALVGTNGELVVIDARGTPWTYDTSVQLVDSEGGRVKAPKGFAAAFILGEKLTVLDGSDVWWTYNAADSSWKEGPSTVDKYEEEGNPWIKGRHVDSAPTVTEPDVPLPAEEKQHGRH